VVDPTRGFGLSPNVLNINGANTYQFVMSNPVDRTAPTGLTDATQILNWLTVTYHKAPPGGDFIDAIGTTPGIMSGWLAADAQQVAIWDRSRCPPIDFFNDPLYEPLRTLAPSGPLTPAEYGAVQNWLTVVSLGGQK
jgi:hypothetical protein